MTKQVGTIIPTAHIPSPIKEQYLIKSLLSIMMPTIPVIRNMEQMKRKKKRSLSILMSAGFLISIYSLIILSIVVIFIICISLF